MESVRQAKVGASDEALNMTDPVLPPVFLTQKTHYDSPNKFGR
jgi:hypothetical protein